MKARGLLFFITTIMKQTLWSSKFVCKQSCLSNGGWRWSEIYHPVMLLCMVVLLSNKAFAANPLNYHIGAVLDSAEHVNQFEKIITDINYDGEALLPPGVRLRGHAMLKSNSPIEDTRQFCRLMSNEVFTVIIDDRIPSEAVTFTSSLHHIPTIGLSNRESIFSDKSLYGSYMRTASTFSHQADVWVQLLTRLGYDCAHFIVSDSINGRNIKTRFTTLADNANLDIESTIEYNYLDPNIELQLTQINEKNSSCRVFVLYADETNAATVLHQVTSQNMSLLDAVWIVSEQALSAPNLPVGFIGVRYKDWHNVGAHIVDSIYVVSSAIGVMHTRVNFTAPPTNCHNIGRSQWLEGDIFYDYLRKQTIIFGKTGKISFDERGDRLYSDYEILNQQYDRNDRSNRHATMLVNIGLHHYNKTSMRIEVDLSERSIVWPGNVTTKPVGYSMGTHFKVATIAEKPFVWVYNADEQGNCAPGQIACPIRRKNAKTGEHYEEFHCCEGYCMDLLQAVASQMNFTYTLYQVEDGTYGSYNYNKKNARHEWTGLLGELYYGRADMVVAALTITPERSLAIDFTKPFKYQGITIMQKRQSIHRMRHPLTSFLQPFQDSLWVSVFVAVHVVALSLYLLDRFSPFGRYKLPNCEAITEEDALNLSSAIWFAWGVLFNSGIGEGTPRSFSGRVLGMIWAGFAMIVVASYTANLAAFLVLDRPETALTGINDPRLRNPTVEFNYSTVKESAVDMYFRRQVELAPMYKRMTGINFDNAEDAIAAVKSGNLNAFIWDSARLEYEAANDCELTISGEHFGRSGYAIGLRKGQTYWNEKVTLTLLGMHEIGFMEDLDNKWILLDKKICPTNIGNFPPTLGLINMAGVFILVGAGILGGVGLIMFEIFYKQHQTRKQKRLELARNAVDKWKEMVENRKLMIESLNLAARQRYKEHRQLHQRRRQQLRNSSSKSYSEEKSQSQSASSSGSGPSAVPLMISTETGQSCNASRAPLYRKQSSTLTNEDNGLSLQTIELTAPPSSGFIKKPTHLELKQTNSPARTSNTVAQPMSTFRRVDSYHHYPKEEQHPLAAARIHHHPKAHATQSLGCGSSGSSTAGFSGNKPRLRREYSVAYEPSIDMPSSRMTTVHLSHDQSDLLPDYSSRRGTSRESQLYNSGDTSSSGGGGGCGGGSYIV